MRCAQMAQEFFPVTSSSSDKVYEVRMWLDGEPTSCNCVAWVMKRNKMKKAGDTGPVECKHVKQVLASVCHWEGDATDKCPLCGGPLVDGTFTAPVAPITEAPSVPEPVVPNGPKLPAAEAAAALVQEMR